MAKDAMQLSTARERDTMPRGIRRHPRAKSLLPAPKVERRFPTAFDNALATLFPRGDISQAATWLFGNKASRRAIFDWRRGKYATPQWALDILMQHLDARAQSMLQAYRDLEPLLKK